MKNAIIDSSNLNLSQFYLITFKALNPKENDKYRTTKCFKYGISTDRLKSRINENTNDFESYYNTSVGIKCEVEANIDYQVDGPLFFIKKLEDDFKNSFFRDENRIFENTDKKREFIKSTVELHNRYTKAINILGSDDITNRIKKLNCYWLNLNHNDETNRLIREDFEEVLAIIRKKLGILPVEEIVDIVYADNNPDGITAEKISIKSVIFKNFRFYVKGSRYYLQETSIHDLNKEVTSYGNAFTCQEGGKMQFHGDSEDKKKMGEKYIEKQIYVKELKNIYGDKIQDLATN